jgi:hypothetical protein
VRTIALAITLFTLLVLTPFVQAQTAVTFESVQVQLWPEYDRPEMLVILNLELAADQTLPVEVSLPMPASAGSPLAVAVLEGSQLVTREFSLETEGDQTLVTILADSPVIRLEYYDPALSQQDQPRTYEFSWTSPYEVREFIVSVKQPVNASRMQITPLLGAGLQDEFDGLTTYNGSLGPVAPDREVSIALTYEKTDTTLAVDAFTPQTDGSPASSDVATIGGAGLPDWAWVMIAIGGAVLIGGVVYLYRINSVPASSRYRSKKKRATTGQSPAASAGKAGVFCHNCGKQSQAGDKFCRECGTRLRG